MRTRNTGCRAAATLTCLWALLWLPAVIRAQDAPPAGDLPAAQDVVAKYHAAVGGADVLAARESLHVSGEFSIQGMAATFEAWSARPNRSAMRVTLPGFGDIRSGYTGEVGWSLNAMEGPRVMEGAEAVQAADDAAFESQMRLPRHIAAMATVELTKLGGHDCYKVRIEWVSGRETFDCYSTDSGLLIGSIAQHDTNLGSTEAITLYEDYQSFDGYRMPTRITVQMMGTEQTITVRDVRFDTVPDSAFDAPPEIRALIGG